MDRPLVTIGIPVYNGEASLSRAIQSALDQDYPALEVVVVDNHSSDSTEDICQELATIDKRIRYVRNDRNIGQNANFTRVATLAKGEYFRWLGVDDWLEPSYASSCVEALEAEPVAVLATTYQRHVGSDGEVGYSEFQGQRVTGSEPVERLEQLLRIFSIGDPTLIDPVYSMVRTDALRRTDLIQKIRFGDILFAAEMALLGPFVHVPRCLSNREMGPLLKGNEAFRQYALATDDGLAKSGWTSGRLQSLTLCAAMLRRVPGVEDRPRERWGALVAVFRYLVCSTVVQRLVRVVRRVQTRLDGA